ncbi:unnamed protein product [Brassica oleracea]
MLSPSLFSLSLAIKKIMSGVWVFKNGVIRLVENPNQSGADSYSRRKVMVYLPTGEVVSSYSMLEQILQSIKSGLYSNSQ